MANPKTRETSVNHHYVPIWYQRRFLAPGETKLAILNLFPEKRSRPDGTFAVLPSVHHRAPSGWFSIPHLYDIASSGLPSDFVEKKWFGDIDTYGARGLVALSEDDFNTWHEHHRHFFDQLGAQKLRTPRGLAFLKAISKNTEQDALMQNLLDLTDMFTTMWVEGKMEIFETESTESRFVFTDSPVTFFNRYFGPMESRRGQDPAFSWKGTQTLYPLDPQRLLVFTHLEGTKILTREVATQHRTNARFQKNTIAKTNDCIRGRKLSREQVRQVNCVLKMAAYEYVAAQHPDDLYPEKQGALVAWKDTALGLIPEFETHPGGRIFMSFEDGGFITQDEHGRTPRTQAEADEFKAEAERMRQHLFRLLKEQKPFGKL
jgi:hypothetical protein